MAKIKKNYRTNFMVVSNEMFRDTRLNLKDRGLLATMMSLPDEWDFSIKGLSSIVQDGEKAVRNCLQHLEEYKYLKRVRIYENGKVVDWQYIFSDHPMSDEEIDEGSSNSQNNNSNDMDKNLVVQNRHLDQNEDLLDVQKVHVGFVHVQKDTQLNIKELNKKELNTNYNDDDNISGIYSESVAFDNPVVVNDDLTDSFSNGSIEGDILSENMAYDCFEDEQFDRFKEDCKESLDDFNKAHKNMKTPSLYRFKDIAMDWIRAKEIYQSDEYVTKAEKMLGKVMNSFAKNNDRRVIASLDKKDLKMLFKAGVDYYDPNSDSEIKNLQKWYAGTLRNMIQNA